MPIRPENRARYPADWPAISRAAKERAGWRCEGSPAYPDCRVPHDLVAWRDADGQLHEVGPRAGRKLADLQALADALYPPDSAPRYFVVILTVGHLDHQPENCDPANLRAWCQRCHLHYDRHHHAETAAATRRQARAAGDLFE